MNTQSIIRDPLANLLKQALGELIDSNIDGIAEKITGSETGKLSVSFGAKLLLKNDQVAATVRLSYTEKHDDSVEYRTKDPNQEELPVGGVR